MNPASRVRCAARDQQLVIAKLNIVGIAVRESNAGAPLVIHGNRVLAGAIAFERMQAIAGRHLKIGQLGGRVYGFELTQGAAGDVGGDPLGLAGVRITSAPTFARGLARTPTQTEQPRCRGVWDNSFGEWPAREARRHRKSCLDEWQRGFVPRVP